MPSRSSTNPPVIAIRSCGAGAKSIAIGSRATRSARSSAPAVNSASVAAQRNDRASVRQSAAVGYGPA
jgi:hypothetical protein